MSELNTRQTFLKGVNRMFPRSDSVDPEHFWTLQNARLFARGKAGLVRRIEGFKTFSDYEYPQILDIVSYRNVFIVMCVRDDEVHLDVLDTEGKRLFNDSFTADTEKGSLLATDQTIFICPYNKILFNTEDGWTLADYRSEAPRITDVSGRDNETPASGIFTITSGIDGGYNGEKAEGKIKVRRNNVPEGREDRFTVKVGDLETDEIVIEYRDSIPTIRYKIYSACRSSDITDEWEVSLGGDLFRGNPWDGPTGPPNGDTVEFKAKSGGRSMNNRRIKIEGSSYEITEEEGGDVGTIGDDGPVMVPSSVPIGGGGNVDLGGGSDGGSSDDKINTAIKITHPSGGTEPRTNIGSLKLYFRTPSIYVETANLTEDDTNKDIMDKVQDALEDSFSFGVNYEVSREDDEPEIEITSIRGGKRYNTGIELTINVDGKENNAQDYFDYEFDEYEYDFEGGAGLVGRLTGGGDADADGTLTNDEDYWYRVRYRYLDGHRTQSSFPVHFNTGPNENIELTIDCSARDLDGGRPEIEVFRKKGHEDFFRIDRVRPDDDQHEYTDDGKHEVEGFSEQRNLWHKNAEAHEVVENRYVRAGVEYYSEKVEDIDFEVEAEDTEDTIECPRFCKAHVYVKPQYVDGTTGYHERVGSVNIKDERKKLKVVQNEKLTNPDKEITDVGYYAKYLPYGEQFIQRFNSPEIANPNIPTIADSSRYPGRTRVFFGFKYISINTESERTSIYTEAWDRSDEDNPQPIRIRHQAGSGSTLEDKLPRRITVSIFGVGYEYVRYAVNESSENSGEYYGIYKLEMYEALKEAVKTNQLRLRISAPSYSTGNLASRSSRSSGDRSRDTDSESSERRRTSGSTRNSPGEEVTDPDPVRDLWSNDELVKTEARVTGLIDRSEDYSDIRIRKIKFASIEEWRILPARDCRLYLELDESEFDEIANHNLNQYNLRRDYSNGDRSWVDLITSTNERTLRGLLNFELLNFDIHKEAEFQEYTSSGSDLDGGKEVDQEDTVYYKYNWKHSIYTVPNRDLLPDDTLVYLGRRSNEEGSKTFGLTGFENPDNDQLNYDVLQSYNIYEHQVDRDSVRHTRLKMPNQLIWTAPLTHGSVTSGGRSISAENFFDVGAEHGDIIEICTIDGQLYVLCEKGVAVVAIGDVVTQQREGQLSIDSSRFMNSHRWIIDGLRGVQRDSVVKHMGQLWFTDGYEVYRLGQSETPRVGQGRIPLNADHEYAATINPEHSEYVLSDMDEEQSWAYNWDFNEWTGPYTYTARHGTHVNSRVFSNANGLVVHNTGNTFDGKEYTTKVYSVANDDTEASFYDKLYRKIYLQLEGDGTFEYGKDPDNLVQTAIQSLRKTNGYYHQGVRSSEQNAKVLYWGVRSKDEDFELRDISWIFNVRNRP